jgi:PAS domain S-box-containing protein
MSSFRQQEIFDPAIHQKDLHFAWKEFIKTGKVDRKVVPWHIAESWERSRKRNIDPFHFPPSAYLDDASYLKLKTAHEYLISIAKPFMENISRSLENSHYIVVLYNSQGYHLLTVGQRAEFESSKDYAIREGLCFEEDQVGTCGFSLVKLLREPMQIIGCEHYSALLHYVVGSYAPVNDPTRGDLMGVIGITTGWRIQPNPHTLAIAIAAGTAIENYIKLDQAKNALSIYGKALQSTMDSLMDGIILIDYKGRIYEMNSSAKEICSSKKEDLKGQHIAEIPDLKGLEGLITNVLKNQNFEKDESETKIREQVYLTTIQCARDQKNEIRGVIVQLKSLKKLSRIVHHLTADHPKFTFEMMVGSSSKTLEVKTFAQLAAQSEANIIIEGESGTGKEILAQAIHNASERAKEPFVVVNCSAIPAELLESSLFGHEKGAFTGAIHTHIGKFELADRGTLFLDEITEMPMNMQAKLLRVLEENRIERVGSQKSIKINVRIIAATNRSVRRELKENRFRKDLFYRLNVFWIKLPPLRDRKEEIYELVPAFIEHFSSVFRKTVGKISDDYYELLMSYDWPGNVRELRNAVQHSMVTLDTNCLLKKHLAVFFRQIWQHDKKGILFPDEKPFPPRLDDLEKAAIQKVLAQTQGNKREAAKLLGIGRATLHRKLKKWRRTEVVGSL